MKKLIASLALLVAGGAWAQGLTPLAPGQTGGGKVLWQAPFATPGCYASGTGGVSITRSSPANYIDANGALQSCAGGSYRVSSNGIYVEPTRKSLLTYSEQFDNTGGWSVTTDVSVSADQAAGPFGGANTADKVVEKAGALTNTTLSAAAGISTSNASRHVASIYVKDAGRRYVLLHFNGAPSAAGCYFDLQNGVALNPSANNKGYSIDQVGSSGWYRISVLGDTTSTVVGFGVSPSANGSSVSYTGDGTSGILLWGAMLEVGPGQSTYIATTSTQVQRDADDVSVSLSGVTLGNKWSLSAAYKKYQGNAWTSGTAFAIDDNTTDLEAKASRLTADASNLVWTILDDAATSQTVTYGWPTPKWSDGSSHTVKVTKNSGALRMLCDGVSCGSASGTISTFSTPYTLYLGRKSSSADYFSGWIKSLQVTSP